MKITIEFWIFESVWVLNLTLNKQFWFLWNKFLKTGYFHSKTEKINIFIEFFLLELVLVPNFTPNKQFWILRTNLPKKKSSGQKWRKCWIMHIRISLCTKFQLILTVLIFWIKFTQKGYFWSKINKVNTTTKFCIFELVWVSNFSLNWQFWFYGLNLPKSSLSESTFTQDYSLSSIYPRLFI